MDHGKLIRDRIPELLGSNRAKVEVRKLEGEELLDALLAKLEEETAELRAADDTSRHEELADVFEVVLALARHWGISLEELRDAAAAKRRERGGFDAGLWWSPPTNLGAGL